MDIYISTLLLIALLVYFKIINIKTIKVCIKEINKSYLELYKENNLIIKLTQVILIIISEICSFIVIVNLVINHISKYTSLMVNNFLKVSLIIILCIVFHYIIGFLLLISSNIHRYMSKGLEESVKSKFLFSYFLISICLVILILYPEKLSEYFISGILSMAASYIIDIKLLIKFMKNPKYIKVNENDRYSFSKVLILAIIIIIFLVFNLFILVSLVNMVDPKSYTNNPSYFDLFYYTIVTFTTIGFGDIVPNSILSKFMAVLISFTSILCMTIFMGSIYSNRKK